MYWSGMRVSNPRPHVPKTRALPSAPIPEILVVDRGLEPTIFCVRGRPPDHLEESTIIKALNYCKMGIEPIYFSWKENVITIRLFAKEFAVRALLYKPSGGIYPLPLSIEE